MQYAKNMSKEKKPTISKEQMEAYDKKLSEYSIEMMKMPISVVKCFADYLVNMVNMASYKADLAAKGLAMDVITIDEYNKKYGQTDGKPSSETEDA